MLTTNSIGITFGNGAKWETVLKGKNPGDQVHLRIKQVNPKIYQADCFHGSGENCVPAGGVKGDLQKIKDWFIEKLPINDKDEFSKFIDSIGGKK